MSVPSADVDELVHIVGPVFAADERVRFAYVFGSVAAGTATARSDIDLGVSVQPRGTLLDPEETAFDAMWEVTAKGPMRVIRAAWPHLAAAGEGTDLLVLDATSPTEFAVRRPARMPAHQRAA